MLSGLQRTSTLRFLGSRRVSILAALAILGVATSLLARGEPAPVVDSPSTGEPRSVTVASATDAAAASVHRAYGTTRAAKRVVASFTVGGRVLSRPVDVGTFVKKGQVLARMDTRPHRNNAAVAEAQLAEMNARLAQQRRDRARSEALWADDVLPRSEMESAQSSFRALKAARKATRAHLVEARRLIGEGTLRADFAGQVVSVHVEPGEFAAPGTPVVALSGEGAVEVEVEVPESVVLRLTQGSPVRVKLPLIDREVGGEVDSVGRSAKAGAGLFPVVVRLESDPDVRPGMTAELAATVNEEAATTVPVAAVLDPSGRRPAVFVLDGDRVRRVLVELGELRGERVRVTGKVKSGDQVVVGGHAFLIDGDRVEVQ